VGQAILNATKYPTHITIRAIILTYQTSPSNTHIVTLTNFNAWLTHNFRAS